jgi:hypothetical protein
LNYPLFQAPNWPEIWALEATPTLEKPGVNNLRLTTRPVRVVSHGSAVELHSVSPVQHLLSMNAACHFERLGFRSTLFQWHSL